MSISLSVSASGLDEMITWNATISRQLPFAMSRALNQMAYQVRQDMKEGTTQYFVGATAYTRNAFRYEKATKTNLTAYVGPDATRRYFPTQIQGGKRKTKKYERFLSRIAPDLKGTELVPTSRIINAAGNPRRSVFGQIQKGLSTKDQRGFFIGKPKGGNRPLGVYRRSKGQLYAYFVEAAPVYRPQFPMERIAERSINNNWSRLLTSSLTKALATPR